MTHPVSRDRTPGVDDVANPHARLPRLPAYPVQGMDERLDHCAQIDLLPYDPPRFRAHPPEGGGIPDAPVDRSREGVHIARLHLKSVFSLPNQIAHASVGLSRHNRLSERHRLLYRQPAPPGKDEQVRRREAERQFLSR